MLHDRTTPHLTSRERQVINLVAMGLSAKEAAVELTIAPCTVERHIENVRLKTRTHNRSHMVAYVIKFGMLDDYIDAESHARRIQLPLSTPPQETNRSGLPLYSLTPTIAGNARAC